MLYQEFDRAQAGVRQTCWLPLERISPRPSVSLEPTDGMTLMELVESIRMHGVIEPVTVQRVQEGRYAIVSGNRRFMACRMAGLTHIDAVVVDAPGEHQPEQALLEAVLAGHMHYLDAAQAMRQLVEQQGMTREELARCLGWSVAAVAQRLRLNELDRELQACLMAHALPENYAHALLKLSDPQARMSILQQTVRERLCIRDVELLVASAQSRLAAPQSHGGRTIALVRDHRLYLNAIRSIVAQMQEAGIDATADERSLEDSVEVTLRLPTRRRRARRTAARGSS